MRRSNSQSRPSTRHGPAGAECAPSSTRTSSSPHCSPEAEHLTDRLALARRRVRAGRLGGAPRRTRSRARVPEDPRAHCSRRHQRVCRASPPDSAARARPRAARASPRRSGRRPPRRARRGGASSPRLGRPAPTRARGRASHLHASRVPRRTSRAVDVSPVTPRRNWHMDTRRRPPGAAPGGRTNPGRFSAPAPRSASSRGSTRRLPLRPARARRRWWDRRNGSGPGRRLARAPSRGRQGARRCRR